MKKIISFILILSLFSALLICGCGQKTEKKSDEADTSATEAAAAEKTGENELLFLWKKDITLQDAFVPTQELDSILYKEISVPASESSPILIRLDSAELNSDLIDSSDGGVSSEYAVVNMDDAAQEEYPKVWKELKNFNEFSEENAIIEIAEGETRYKAYRQADPDASYIYLTSRTGIELKRTDSGILSYFRTVYRYNRGYEPNYYEVYGRTIDPSTGRVLTLNDILTDTGGLPQMIWDALVKSGFRNDTDPDKEAFIEILQTAIQGCRDDGSFGWTLDPLGIEFSLVESYTAGESTEHRRERAYIPFSRCRDILRPGIAEPSYDVMVQLTEENTEELTSADAVRSLPEKPYRYDYYYVTRSGNKYLYCSLEDHTDLYRIEGQNIEKIGEVSAEIGYNHYGHMCEVLSPDSYIMTKTANLLQKLFLEADAHSDEYGMVVRDGYYRLKTNPIPIMTGASFEAEIYENAESTESVNGTVPEYSILTVVRSDGESFIDCSIEDEERIARLYVDGDKIGGWTVNGHPMEDVIGHQGWFEE